jgi:hypothetical protein
MIRFNQSTNQIRIDTTIKIIEKDGTEVTAPVMILIGLNKTADKHHYSIYKWATSTFHKIFIINRQQPQPPVKKAWWKVW